MRWVLTPETIRAILPRKPRSSFDWISEYIRTPDGKAFNPHDYPWTKGICEAWDNPEVRQITLQFAARLGKTFIANAMMICAIEFDPCTGMIAMPTEQLLKEMIRDKYYRMLDRCTQTYQFIPHEDDRTMNSIEFNGARIYGAWSGSSTTLADKAPKYKHGGEVDKFTRAKSFEADPLQLLLERGIEIPDRKSIVESTPTFKNKSRIESHLITGWNARFNVPCPKCKKFAPLIFGDGTGGGVIFDRPIGPDGKPRGADIGLAKRTARYRCPLCSKEWGDEYRRDSILQGIWVPDGMHLDSRRRLQGTMTGAADNASFQLSRLYAPTFTFGDIAGQLAACILDPEKWQNTNNSWKGETHVLRSATKDWDEVGVRLTSIEYSKDEVPECCIFVTAGVDVQIDHYVFVIVAWAKDGIGYVVDWGISWNEDELRERLKGKYQHKDGGPAALVARTLIDSGEGRRQDEIFDLCEALNEPRGRNVWPSKGSTGNLAGGKLYKESDFEDLDARRKDHSARAMVEGFKFVTVNTPFYQSWIHSALHYRTPGTPKSLALPIEARTDEDFLKQLVNEKPEDMRAKTGHSSVQFVVVDEQIPCDFRDALRYARCAADSFIRGAWMRLGTARRIVVDNQSATAKPRRQDPGPPSSQGFVRGKKAFVRTTFHDRFSN